MRSLTEKLWIRDNKNIIFFIFIFLFFHLLAFIEVFNENIYRTWTKCPNEMLHQATLFFLAAWKMLENLADIKRSEMPEVNIYTFILPLSMCIHFFFSVLVIPLLLRCTDSKFHNDHSVCFYYIQSSHSKPSSKSLKVLLKGLTFSGGDSQMYKVFCKNWDQKNKKA